MYAYRYISMQPRRGNEVVMTAVFLMVLMGGAAVAVDGGMVLDAKRRVQGAAGDETSHVENRMGEPAANPYLYVAANIAAGLDGIRRQLEPPPPVEADPYAAEAPMLPTSLGDAIDALAKDTFYRGAFGDVIVDYLIQMKRAEFARYESAIAQNPPPEGQDVSEWEMREYFEFY